jgi:hypothetical protein
MTMSLRQDAQCVGISLAKPHRAHVLEAIEAPIEQVRLFGKEREIAGVVQVDVAMFIGPTGFTDLCKNSAVELPLESALEERREVVRLYLAAQDRQLFHHRIP